MNKKLIYIFGGGIVNTLIVISWYIVNGHLSLFNPFTIGIPTYLIARLPYHIFKLIIVWGIGAFVGYIIFIHVRKKR